MCSVSLHSGHLPHRRRIPQLTRIERTAVQRLIDDIRAGVAEGFLN